MIELFDQPATLVRIDHLDEGDAAAELGFEVGVVRAVLGGEAVLASVVEDGAEAADFAAADAGAIVDDDSGDAHRRASLEDARFLFVDGEAFVLRDVANSGEQVAGFVGRLRRLGGPGGGERQVVGVAGVLPAEFGGDAGQARIETAGNEIR